MNFSTQKPPQMTSKIPQNMSKNLVNGKKWSRNADPRDPKRPQNLRRKKFFCPKKSPLFD